MNHSQIEHGTSVRDPVCGMNVDPKSTPHTGSFGGQTHFFCSQNCLASSVVPRSGMSVPIRRRERETAPFQRELPRSIPVQCIRKFGSKVLARAPNVAWR